VLEDFIQAVAARTAPICGGSDGRRSVALIEAIYQSTQTHLAVDIP
jgi:predicted dehydrogenase